jgi:hypothetical protein
MGSGGLFSKGSQSNDQNCKASLNSLVSVKGPTVLPLK